jgi:PAS domain S-box-containing protein
MFDKEFLKTLTIMYVEDDESIRTSLSSILKKIFGEVIICNDGNDGVNQFKYYTLERKTKIDAIVSDINMPNLNGIDMVREVRALDEEIPIIFTTAHGESNYLMEAIKLKVSYYALKPINTTELLQNISKFCTIEHNKQLVAKKEQQISQYMDIMNDITAIFKTDTTGKIIEVNEELCEISEYSEDELLNMTISDILNKDSIVTNYEDILNKIGKDEKYIGKLKFSSKNNNVFYLKTTIIPTISDATSQNTGHIYIGLDQTGDELEKQQTMQRVRKNIVEQRGKESQLLSQIKQLEEENLKLQQNAVNSKDTEFAMSALTKEKQKVTALNAQLSHYEKEIAQLEKQKNNIVSEEKNKKIDMMKRVKELSSENNTLQSKVIDLQTTITRLEEKLRGKTVG